MGTEQPAFTNLDKSFQDFLNEVQKTTIPEDKKREIGLKLQEAFNSKKEDAIPTKTKMSDNEELIHLDMNKYNRNSKSIHSAHLTQKAATWASNIALFSAGLFFITIGFLLIVTPATPEFEIATIFYFNENDGFTVMDLFALVIVFMGVFLFIRAFIVREQEQ